LYLIASPRTGPDARGVSKRWQLRLNVPTEPGIRRQWKWAGLGGFPDTTLSAAREEAAKMRAMMRQGIDPIIERRKAKAAALKATRDARTLDQAFEACLANRVATAGWKNGTSSAQWRSEHKRYIAPEIGSTLVELLEVADVLHVVRPKWTEQSVLADRLLSRLEQVIQYAILHRWRPAAAGNPAEQARMLLPKHKAVHKVKHYAALPAEEMPAFPPSQVPLHFAARQCTAERTAVNASSSIARARRRLCWRAACAHFAAARIMRLDIALQGFLDEKGR
jgi:hypothetical protein